MPSNYTTNYKLNQWAADDQVRRVDFNEDNSKLDDALAAKADKASLSLLETAMSKKAEQSALTSLQTTVNKKADQTALDALSKTVSGHTSALETKGNCRVVFSTYTGNGADSRTHTFSEKPLLVFLLGNGGYILVTPWMASVVMEGSGSNQTLNAAWSGSSLTLSTTKGAGVLLNFANVSYQIVAFFDADA